MKRSPWLESLLGGPASAGTGSLGLKDVQIFFESGDKVRFYDREGARMTGTVDRLNPKYAVVMCRSGGWRVPYHGLDHLCSATAAKRRPRAARLRKVADLARRQMDLHGLSDWTLRFSSTRARLGSCHSFQMMIQISLRHAVSDSLDDVTDTILHEIAHALAGPAARHGPEWKAIAARLGATPKACAPESDEVRRRRKTARKKFQIGDKVTFAARGMCRKGTIRRLNPKRAKVICSDSSEWLVPYAKLGSAGNRDSSGVFS